MELVKVINSRRSIRKYISKDVPDSIIEELIDVARFAPSAKNRQPWHFLIVKGEMKNNIADMMIKDLETSKIDLEKEIYHANNSVKATALVMKETPILILVFRPKDANWIVGDSLSIGAAIEHICLRATDLGLGSLWIRDIVYTKEQIANMVSKEHLDLISAISIGYPDEEPRPKTRKSLSEVLEWYQ